MRLTRLVSVVFLFGLLPSAATAQVVLGDPPRDPRADRVPRSSSSVRALTVAPINTNDRNAVVQLFRTVYLPTVGVAAAWTGNVSTCTGGTTSAAYKDATFARVNYYRAMAGLPGTVTSNNSLEPANQAAALMMSANGAANHNPPTGWLCYTSAGATAAARS